MKNRKTEEEIDAIVDDILDENQDNDFDATRSEACPGDCEKPNNIPKESLRQCKCGVENSTRFTLRVMEAMRSLQRDVDQPSTSSAEDIVGYIRTNYRNDGDLYAQVRTALRQVCFQGFVMELLNNEYHLIGPVVSPIKQNGCSADCESRILTTIDDTSRRRKRYITNHRNGPPHEESLRDTFDFEDLNTSDIQDDRQQRDITRMRKIQQRDEEVEPIPGPSREFTRIPSPTPARNAKKVRLEDRSVPHADENDEETEDDDVDRVAQIIRDSRRRPLDRTRVRDRENVEEDEEDERERIEEEDEDTEDSAYRELRAQGTRRRTRARERELRKWIRRCRRECERRRMR